MFDYGYVLTAPDHGGAYDIVGDVHGHARELFHLLQVAGWRICPFDVASASPICASHPDNRLLVLTGDLVNHGPQSDLVLRLYLGMRAAGTAIAVMGNHDLALLAGLHEKAPKKPRTPLDMTLTQVWAKGAVFAQEVTRALCDMPHQLRLPMPDHHPMKGDGVVSVVHAVALERNLDKATKTAKERAIFGTFGENKGKPRKGPSDWAHRYHGKRWIVHGHTPMPGIGRRGQVIGIDTGAAKGGQLTMLRLDTITTLSVPMGMKDLFLMPNRSSAAA